MIKSSEKIFSPFLTPCGAELLFNLFPKFRCRSRSLMRELSYIFIFLISLSFQGLFSLLSILIQRFEYNVITIFISISLSLKLYALFSISGLAIIVIDIIIDHHYIQVIIVLISFGF